MGLNIIKDWKNYRYTKECFRILVEDAGMREFYQLKYYKGVRVHAWNDMRPT
jgi:hypothetical protein